MLWTEGRPAEGGRNVLVRATAGGPPRDVTPSAFNVRTRVHEYGGGAYARRTDGSSSSPTTPTSACTAGTAASRRADHPRAAAPAVPSATRTAA